eukprot:g16271.t1
MGDGGAPEAADQERRGVCLLAAQLLLGTHWLSADGPAGEDRRRALLVCKFFGWLGVTSQLALAAAALAFDEWCVVKPVASRSANAEAYLACQGPAGPASARPCPEGCFLAPAAALPGPPGFVAARVPALDPAGVDEWAGRLAGQAAENSRLHDLLCRASTPLHDVALYCSRAQAPPRKKRRLAAAEGSPSHRRQRLDEHCTLPASSAVQLWLARLANAEPFVEKKAGTRMLEHYGVSFKLVNNERLVFKEWRVGQASADRPACESCYEHENLATLATVARDRGWPTLCARHAEFQEQQMTAAPSERAETAVDDAKTFSRTYVHTAVRDHLSASNATPVLRTVAT